MIILLSLTFLIMLPFLLYLIAPTKNLAVTVYDKTVPDRVASQHQVIGWFLRQQKYLTDEGRLFRTSSSYRGYHPKNKEIVGLSPLTEKTDLLYIADTYGIYRHDSVQQDGIRNLIYGGLDDQDIQALKTFLNRKQASTLIAEYNSFASPTPSHIQSQMYELTGSRWTGWAGQWVYNLALGGDTPSWILGLKGDSWDYSGSGLILYNIYDEVVVLTSGVQLGSGAMQLALTAEGKALAGDLPNIAYHSIFDIVEPQADTNILATYSLDVTEEGAKLLKEHGLPTAFPAIVEKEVANHTMYYFAGNWAYNKNPIHFSDMQGLEGLMERLAFGESIFTWKFYYPMLRSIFAKAEATKETALPAVEPSFDTVDGTRLMSRTKGGNLQVYTAEGWKDLFIHGVNIGIARPGRWFTEFPQDKLLYYQWLEGIGKMGINTVRIYTLLDPQFYDALHLYNQLHQDNPLYLLQEIWPEEYPQGHNYLAPAYLASFEEEIRNVVDAIHGKADIAPRKGRAWGLYSNDLSQYVLGYLVGRELEPEEVEATDQINAGYTYSGEYLKTDKDASPTEAWLARSIDVLLDYEEKQYLWQHPASVVNWPTLDYLDHPSERDEFGVKKREYNDRTVVNINHLDLGPKMKGGLFGSYHIYPNYPDFMNNDSAYALYSDNEGTFRYGGYLQAFMAGHHKYPAVVAEFGLATGVGNAHANPDGYNHGGMSEEVQGEGIIRMFEAMQREGYAGGIIFEWIDEWAKKAWTTEPYMIPYERQNLWHNAIDPEQNYGIMAYEAVKPAKSGATLDKTGLIRTIELRLDATFLDIDITLQRPIDFNAEQLLIGIDTYRRDRGELKYLPTLDLKAPSGMEYLVVLDGVESGRLLAIPPYNYTTYSFASYPGLSETGTFEGMAKLINKARALEDLTPIPAHYENASSLFYGSLTGSSHHWDREGNVVKVRIPFTRINISDPSSATVLDDTKVYYSDPLRDVIATTESEGIAVSAVLCDANGTQVLDGIANETPLVLPWTNWNQPVYRERLKQSYGILQQYLHNQRSVQ